MGEIFTIQTVWAFFTLISFWNTIDSTLKLLMKVKYSNTVYDKDISQVATSITMLVLFAVILFQN